MSRSDRFGTPDLIVLFIILNVASLGRLGYQVAYCDWGRNEGPLRFEDVRPDTQEIAKSLIDGTGFSAKAPLANAVEPTGHVAPGYPWLVSAVRRFLPDPADRWLRNLQAEAAAVACLFWYLVAFRAFGNRAAAALAGLGAALYPPWVVQPATLTDGTFTMVFLVLSLWFAQRVAADGGVPDAIVLGLLLAALSLTRASTLPFAAGLALWGVWRCRSAGHGIIPVALLLVAFAGGLAPWCVRNMMTLGTVNVATSGPYHFAAGTGAGATGGPRSETAIVAALADVDKKSPTELQDELAGMAQAERYDRVAALARKAAWREPAAWLYQRLGAFAGFWLGDEGLRQQRLFAGGLPGRDAPIAPESQPLAAWLLLLSLLTLAFFGWRWSFRRSGAGGALAVAVVLLPLPTILSYAEPLAGPRLPLDGVLLAFAAFAVACLVPRVGPLRDRDDKP